MRKYLLLIIFGLIPFLVHAIERETTTWHYILQGLDTAFQTTKADSALLLGLLGQETFYGINIGKPAAQQKPVCEKTKLNEYRTTQAKKEGFFGWNDVGLATYAKAKCLGLDALKITERIITVDGKQKNVGDLLKEQEKPGYYGYFKNFCNANSIPLGQCDELYTSYTFALGFTQFQPDQWIFFQSKYRELVSPWTFRNALSAAGYKLNYPTRISDGTSETKALNNYYGSSTQIACHNLGTQGSYAYCVQSRKKVWQERLNNTGKIYSLEKTISTLQGRPISCTADDQVCSIGKLRELAQGCTVPDFGCIDSKITAETIKQTKNAEDLIKALQQQKERIAKQEQKPVGNTPPPKAIQPTSYSQPVGAGIYKNPFQDIFDFFPLNGTLQQCVKNQLGDKFALAYNGEYVSYTLMTSFEKCVPFEENNPNPRTAYEAMPLLVKQCMKNSLGSDFEKAMNDPNYKQTPESEKQMKQCSGFRELESKFIAFENYIEKDKKDGVFVNPNLAPACLEVRELNNEKKFVATSLTGQQLKRAWVKLNQNTGEPSVEIEFTSEGSKLFAEITKKNIGKSVALFIDGTLVSAPNVMTEITGGYASIVGGYTEPAAKELVERLNAGRGSNTPCLQKPISQSNTQTPPSQSPKAVIPINPAQTHGIGYGSLPPLGDPNAKVKIVMFGGYDEIFTRRFYERTEPLLRKEYIQTGKVVLYWRDGFSFGIGEGFAQNAARCAAEQGKFWEYRDQLFQTPSEQWTPSAIEIKTKEYKQEALKNLGKSIGLDSAKFNLCVDSIYPKSQQDIDDGQSYGVTGTPTFFINGEVIHGAVELGVFRENIEAALKR